MPKAIYLFIKKAGLLTVEEKDIKSSQEILGLLQALCLTINVAVIHCPRYQSGGFT